MRYLSAIAILLFSSAVQANPTTFYRALKHLGFDNKRIAKIVTGVASQAKNNETYVLITKKIKDVSSGYRFSQKKSGELVMQKFEVHSGVPSLGQEEIIDPNLSYYQLALSELVGLTGKQANKAERLLRTGQPLDLVLSPNDLANHVGVILQSNNGKLTQQYYLVVDGVKEFDDRELVDFAMLHQRQVRQKISAQQRIHQVFQGIFDDINNRKIIDIVKDKAKSIKQLPTAKDNTPQQLPMNDIISMKQTRQQHLLSVLFTDKSLDESDTSKLLFEILDISGADIAKKFSLPLSSRSVPKYYMKGGTPSDRLDIRGINKRQLLNELLHEEVNKKVAISSISSDDADKIHNIIDERFPVGMTIRRVVDPDQQQQLLDELFGGKSLTKQERARLLIEILGVHKANVRTILSLSPRNMSIAVSRYMNGSIPFDSVDRQGVNRLQAFKKLLHDRVSTSSFDSDIVDKLHVEIDEVYITKKTILDKALDIDAPQKFFSARSFSKVVADKRQGKVYLTDSELVDYQAYLYDEIAEVAIESGREKQAIALIKKHAEALDVTICDSGDCSVNLIENYIDAIDKSLREQANKNYLDEFKPKEVAVDLTKTTTVRLSENISSIAKGKNTYGEVAEGVTVTKYFAKKFTELPAEHQNPIVEIIENTSDVVQQWRETIQQEGILSYLKENVKTYQRVKKPRRGEARNVKLYTLRIDRRTTLYFKQDNNASIVLANLTTNNSQNAYDDGIKKAVSSLQNHYRN